MDYEIIIPQNLDAEISNTNGDIYIENIDGDLDIATADGDITVDNISGSVEASNINGKIVLSNIDGEVDVSSVNGNMTILISSVKVNCKAKTTNGDIALYIRDNASTQGTLRTTNGKIKSDFQGERSRRGGRLEFVLGSGDGKLDIRTTNGDIKLLMIDVGTRRTRRPK